ncbi:MAG: hypothetical protein QNM02_02770 [Acidimicrobiia bacterium]|nr:hypothetical protein [Acidimicrobiia bacterium]
MGFKGSTRAAAVVAGLTLALAACGGGGGSLDDDGGGDSDDLDDLLGELGLDADDLEGLDLDELENLDVGDLENLDGNIGDLGSLAEIFGALGLEELIENNADGDVDVELGDDGFSIESEDGTFSIDEDGSFSVTDEDGEETTGDIDIDGSDGGMSIESEDGSIEFNSGSDIPDDWPADVPEPEGVTIQSAMTFSEGDGSSIVLTGTTDESPEDWAGAYGSQLEDAGFAEESNFNAGGGVTAFYTRDTMGVAVIVASIGDDTSVSVSITNDQ